MLTKILRIDYISLLPNRKNLLGSVNINSVWVTFILTALL